jgi:hypothetical protein
MLEGLVQQQASLSAYIDNFRLLAGIALLCIPLVLLFATVRRGAGKGADQAAD